MAIVETKDGKSFESEDISNVKLLDSSVDMVNPLWIVFWLLVFFPMAIALAIAGVVSKKYTCVITVNGGSEVHTFDKANYHLLNLR